MSSTQVNTSRRGSERTRHAYKAKVRKLVAETFGLSNAEMHRDDQIWEHWLARVERERELSSFLRGKAKVEMYPLRFLLQDTLLKDSFKARVISVLCAPTLGWTPFRYPTQDSAWSYVSEWFSQFAYGANRTRLLVDVIGDLSERLQQFFWALLRVNLDAIGWKKPQGLDNPTPMVSDRNIAYNQTILYALTVLPAESNQAAQLFRSYHMNPSWTWLGLWLPGADYSPFQEILKAAVPEQWKEQADVQWRQAVLEKKARFEKEGGQFAMHSWFDTLLRYTAEVQWSWQGYGRAVSVRLFASQVDWILGAIEGTACRPFRYDSWNHVLNTLQDEEYRPTCYRFVRHMVLTDDEEDPFWVTDDTEPLVQRALALFGNTDPVVATKLRAVLAKRAAQVAARDEESLQTKAAVMAMY